jgi:FKBP-type peptidyl-prolyl cis-trans isomerase (trigger factor)
LYLLSETKSSKQKNSKVISKRNVSKIKVIKTSLSKKNKTQTITNELKVSTGNLVSLDYILHETSEDGKVLETTIEDVARNNSIYKDGISYKPMLVMVGTKSVIVGFEKGLMGMKKGEKKIIKISPEE